MTNLTRRHFIHCCAALLATPALAQEADDGSTEIEQEISQGVRHNVSSFRALEWKPYFSNLNYVMTTPLLRNLTLSSFE